MGMLSKGTGYSCSLKSFFVLLVVLGILGQCCSGPVHQSDPQNSEDLQHSLIYVAVLTLGVLVTLISALFICGAGGCCGLDKIHWFGRTRANQEGPMSFENPVALEVGTMMTQLSQIDVRALELDPVVFEPLPSIQDLSPLNVNTYAAGGQKTRGGGVPAGGPSHSPSSFLNSTGLPSSIPFSNKDTNVFAHDWFEEPYDNFSRNNLEYLREVGKGWFGQVMEADAKDIVPYARNLRVLVKILRNDASQLDQMKFLDESRWYRDSAECGNILKLLGHSLEKLPFLLIMEQCPQGDLKSFLISNVIRAEMLSSQGTLLKMALDIAKGLEWMASADFVHHDLAARNCQVASEGRVVLGDYGLSTQQYKDDYYWNSNVPIPLRWTAPETLHITSSTIQTLEVSKLSNIWTFAIVLWEIMEFGKLPYFELNDEEVISRVIAAKNYVLGQPTLPYIPLKEQLYGIMTSCWSIDPIKRPAMSLIVSELNGLLHTLTTQGGTPSSFRSKPAATSTPQEQFDTKWENIGRSSTSSSISGLGANNGNGNNDEKRKKSVSFTGLMEDSKASDLLESDTMREMDNNSFLAHSNGGSAVGEEDDCNWSRISKKVQEKSQSVQNLMVLTHVDTSELGDPDSLLFVVGDKTIIPAEEMRLNEFQSPTSPANSISSTSTNSPKPPPNTPNTPNDIVFQVQPLVSSIENRLDELNCQYSTDKVAPHEIEVPSHQRKNSSLSGPKNEKSVFLPVSLVPQISLVPSSPGTTPNKTGIDINVIQPSPSPNANMEKESTPVEIPSQKRAVKFVFSPNIKSEGNSAKSYAATKERRNTSTPISSPAVDLNTTLPDGEVFQDIEETEINTTGPISPIKCARRIPCSGELVTTVLMGASDDYGLSEYQGVSTSLIDSSLSHSLNSQIDSDDVENLTSLSKGFRSVVVPLDIHNNGVEVDAASVEAYHENHLLKSNLKNQTSEVASNGGPFCRRPMNGTEGLDDSATKSDGDEFWSDQIEKMRNGTESTKALFDLSLAEDGSYVKERFVEDIETAQEDLGSLVLTDLEDDNNSVHTIVPESSREHVIPNELETKMAFVPGTEDSVNDETSTLISSKGYLASVSSSSLETTEWDVNSSVDIEKARLFVDKSILDMSWSGPKKETVQEEVSSFVPSKWNQTLTPVRPAIKSPAVVPVEKEEEHSSKPGGMKKSVSFERNKTQLVYKYPPPDPGSDSDGDESHISLNARLRLSSGTNSGTSTRTAIPIFPSAASLGKQ